MNALLPISVLLLISSVLGQDVPWETTCVTDPNGYPRLHVENNHDFPMAFGIYCDNMNFLVYVDPHTTKSVPAYFEYQPESLDSGNCLLYRISATNGIAAIFSWTLDDDEYVYAYNYTYCSELPGLERRLESYTDCQMDNDGLVQLNYHNNLDDIQFLSVYCGVVDWDEADVQYDWYFVVYDFELPARTQAQMFVEFFNGFQEEQSTCFFFPGPSGYSYVYYDSMDVPGNFYLEAALWCTGRRAMDAPIVKLLPHCPKSTSDAVSIELRADVPAYAVARCRNGDQPFSTINSVTQILTGSFSDHKSKCLFYKKQGVETYTVDVEVGWGEEDREVFVYQKIHTVSCSYDMHGTAESSVELINDWFISPNELQVLNGQQVDGPLQIRVLDVLDRQINTNHITIGRMIRLKAEDPTGTIPAFRALSCVATNGVSSYPILRAGCGDGVVLKKDDGFVTDGNMVVSPFFSTFKLRGGGTLWFNCRFTVCGSAGCDGSSCPTWEEVRQKRSLTADPAIVTGSSLQFNLS